MAPSQIGRIPLDGVLNSRVMGDCSDVTLEVTLFLYHGNGKSMLVPYSLPPARIKVQRQLNQPMAFELIGDPVK